MAAGLARVAEITHFWAPAQMYCLEYMIIYPLLMVYSWGRLDFWNVFINIQSLLWPFRHHVTMMRMRVGGSQALAYLRCRRRGLLYGSWSACGFRVEWARLSIREVHCSYTRWYFSGYHAGSPPTRAYYARRDSGCLSVGGPYAESISSLFNMPWCCDVSHKMRIEFVEKIPGRVLPERK